ncbi:hypothetical protein DNU06_16280 [Putridiphycobacter roseus]|uniref:Uncharacterized protein n=2 Tax=Putridiphycobacter roseus TaxID=2219161 RepID=A0A2W1MUU4_9FLAO|nr:hypothetical protein DNU06_16280 [Putridiphycobacter roseus]
MMNFKIHAQNQIVIDSTCTELSRSVPFTFEEQVATVFEHVDLMEVTNGNGLLYEHGFPLYTIEPTLIC